MKFPYSPELKSFIKEHQLFSNYKEMEEIYTGGSSFNFKVYTSDGIYFLKLVTDYDNYRRLRVFIPFVYPLYALSEEKFQTYYMVAMPYIDGHKLRFHDADVRLMHCLAQTYLNFRTQKLPSEFIAPQHEIEQLFQQAHLAVRETGGFEHRVLSFIIRHFEKDKMVLPTTGQVIHGDLSANNVMVADGKTYLLDFDAVRYGYTIEDVAGLMLQLSGFRGGGGLLHRLKFLCDIVDKEHLYSYEEWIYGTHFFYLKRFLRRQGQSKKRRSFRKTICLLWSLLGYFRVRHFLQQRYRAI